MLTCVKNRFDPSSVSSNHNCLTISSCRRTLLKVTKVPGENQHFRYFCVLWNSTKIALKTKCISIVCCKHKLSTTVIIKVMRLSMKATIFPNELYYRTIVFLLQRVVFTAFLIEEIAKPVWKSPQKTPSTIWAFPNRAFPGLWKSAQQDRMGNGLHIAIRPP